MRRLIAVSCVVLALPLVLPALVGAQEPWGPVSPADGAVVSTDPNGLPFTFACPEYVIFGTPPFATYGYPRDYTLSLATSATTGPHGRLTAVVTSGTGSPFESDALCEDVRIGSTPGSFQPEDTPGTYFWQIARGFGNGTYEVSPIRRLVVRTNAKLTLRPPATGYAGFPFQVRIELAGAPDGTMLQLQRRARKSWRTIASLGASLGAVAPAVRLPLGRHALRARARIGSDTVVSPVRRMRVVPPKRWQTGAEADGLYRDPQRDSVRFRIVDKGRTLRDFRADITTQCPSQPTGIGTNRVVVPRVKIAPDGRFIAIGRTSGIGYELIGRLTARKVAATARVVTDVCAGSINLRAGRVGT